MILKVFSYLVNFFLFLKGYETLFIKIYRGYSWRGHAPRLKMAQQSPKNLLTINKKSCPVACRGVAQQSRLLPRDIGTKLTKTHVPKRWLNKAVEPSRDRGTNFLAKKFFLFHS